MLLYSSYYKNKKSDTWRGIVAADRTYLHWTLAAHTSTTLTYQIKVIVVAAAAWPLANGCVPSTAAAVAVGLGCHAR